MVIKALMILVNSDVCRQGLHVSISVRGGGRGVAAPQLWRNFQKSAPFGQMFAFSRAKMLAHNGLCVGQSPPLDFLFPYAYALKYHLKSCNSALENSSNCVTNGSLYCLSIKSIDRANNAVFDLEK